MEYFLIDFIIDDSSFFCTYAEHPKWLPFKIWSGEEIEEPFQIDLVCEMRKFILNDLVSGYTTTLVVSDKFKDLFQEIESDNIQFHPARLLDRKGNVVSAQYWHINILNNLEVFDWENSDYTIKTWDSWKKDIIKWKPSQLNEIPEDQKDSIGIRDLNHVVLKNVPSNRHIFRVNNIETKIFVSEVLRSKIIDAGITGVQFLSLDNLGL